MRSRPVLAAATALLCVLAACGRNDTPASTSTARVARGTLVEVQLLTGSLDAERAHRVVVPATPAWDLAIRWLAEDGARVEAGDLLAELDAGELLTALTEATGQAESARDELVKQESAGERELSARAYALAEAEAALRRAEVDAGLPPEIASERERLDRELAVTRAKAARDRAREELRAAVADRDKGVGLQRITIDQAAAKLQTSERSLAALRLTAPAAGVVVIAAQPWEGRKLQVGDELYPGFPVATIPELASLRVIASLSDVDDGRVRPQMPATCVLDAYPDRPLACRVLTVAPVAQEPARMSLRRAFLVTVGFSTVDEERMRPGMSVRVEVETARHPDLLLVPRGAVDWGGERPSVRHADGRVAALELGPCDAQRCAVVSGLAEGDEVLLPAPLPRESEEAT